jgi:hypothetical protein
MAEPHGVSALVAQRAELAGGIELTTRKLQGFRAALEHPDATLCLFGPRQRSSSPRWAGQGRLGKAREMTRICLDTLRRASAPLCKPGHRACIQDRARHGHG